MTDSDFPSLPKLETHIHGPLRSTNLDDLHLVLEESASRHARTVLREFTDEDHGQVAAALHAGLAIEHLAKRYLVGVSPVLIAENDFNSLLMLSGHGQLTKVPAHQVKTITGAEACKRVKLLHPEFPYQQGRDDHLFYIRNAAAHLGVTDTAPMRRAVVQMVRLANSLIGALGLDAGKFWAESMDAVVQLSDQAASEMRAIMAAKYSAASSRVNERVAGLDPKQCEMVLRALSGQHRYQVEQSLGWPCPVCAQSAWLECSREYVGNIQPALDAAGEPISIADTVLHPEIFDCSTCGLYLEGDELREADIPETVEVGPQPLDDYDGIHLYETGADNDGEAGV
jgi:hypothetical protein